MCTVIPKKLYKRQEDTIHCAIAFGRDFSRNGRIIYPSAAARPEWPPCLARSICQRINAPNKVHKVKRCFRFQPAIPDDTAFCGE